MGPRVGRYIAICLWVLSVETEILDNRDQSTDYLPSAQSKSSIGITLCMLQKRVLIWKKKKETQNYWQENSDERPLPMWTSKAAEDLSVVGSLMSIAFRPLVNSSPL